MQWQYLILAAAAIFGAVNAEEYCYENYNEGCQNKEKGKFVGRFLFFILNISDIKKNQIGVSDCFCFYS